MTTRWFRASGFCKVVDLHHARRVALEREHERLDPLHLNPLPLNAHQSTPTPKAHLHHARLVDLETDHQLLDRLILPTIQPKHRPRLTPPLHTFDIEGKP